MGLQHATCENIGIRIRAKDDDPESKQSADDAIREADEYLHDFTSGPKCPGCDLNLGGFLGSFVWGIANGEGNCSQCHYPARALHRNAGPFEFFENILPYHPDYIGQKLETEEVALTP